MPQSLGQLGGNIMRGKVGLFAAVVAMLVVTLLAPGSAGATIPLAKSRPFQAVCEAQGGMFQVAIDFGSLYCDKTGGLFTAFTPNQPCSVGSVSGCGAFFGVQGFIRPDGVTGTGTFCHVEC